MSIEWIVFGLIVAIGLVAVFGFAMDQVEFDAAMITNNGMVTVGLRERFDGDREVPLHNPQQRLGRSSRERFERHAPFAKLPLGEGTRDRGHAFVRPLERLGSRVDAIGSRSDCRFCMTERFRA